MIQYSQELEEFERFRASRRHARYGLRSYFMYGPVKSRLEIDIKRDGGYSLTADGERINSKSLLTLEVYLYNYAKLKNYRTQNGNTQTV